MYPRLSDTIAQLGWEQFADEERKASLQLLIDFIQQKVTAGQPVNLNFICTHNSRRSHLAQVWAQTAATYFKIPNVCCYSGGTEETALFPQVAQTLTAQGFQIFTIAEGDNAAIMTCSQADGGCPFIAGADKRIPLTFEDPKVSDGTQEQAQIYHQRSLQIATALFYVFHTIRL